MGSVTAIAQDLRGHVPGSAVYVSRNWPAPLENVTVSDVLANSQEIDFRQYSGGMIHIPAGSSITALTFNVATKKGGTYLPAYDTSNTAISLTVAAGRAYPVPDTIFGANFIKLTGDAAGVVDFDMKA